MSSNSRLLTTVLISLITGNLINWLLHGVLTVQIYLYYLAFPDDRTWTKVAVYTTYILETIQTFGIGITILLILARGSPYPAAFDSTSFQSNREYLWSVKTSLIRVFGGLVPLIAQSIYAHRIRVITQGTIIPGIIIVLAILQLSAAIVTMTIPAHPSMIVYVTWAGLNIVNDLIIAFIMTLILSNDQPWSLSNYTRMKVRRLFHLIIATGSLTITVNVLSIVLLFTNEYVIHGYTGTSGAIFMPKVYANSILAMLNNRMSIRSPQFVPISMGSINIPSTFKIADDRLAPSDSAMSHDGIGISSFIVGPPV